MNPYYIWICNYFCRDKTVPVDMSLEQRNSLYWAESREIFLLDKERIQFKYLSFIEHCIFWSCYRIDQLKLFTNPDHDHVLMQKNQQLEIRVQYGETYTA